MADEASESGGPPFLIPPGTWEWIGPRNQKDWDEWLKVPRTWKDLVAPADADDSGPVDSLD